MKRSKLKRRLRKKLHVGEFQVFGFEISVKFRSNLEETLFDNFISEFIDKVEEDKLLFGGGGDLVSWDGFVSGSNKNQSPSAPQRDKIKNWLENHGEISKCEVGNFKDAWYDNKKTDF